MINASTIKPVADELIAAFADACESVFVAGSVRRGRENVKDLEIVARPKLYQQIDLFGKPFGVTYSELDQVINRLVNERVLSTDLGKNGPRYKVFGLNALLPTVVKLDLFIVRPPAQFGALLAIRTGPLVVEVLGSPRG